MLGDQSAGKTCLVSRFVNDKFNDNQAATLAQDFKAKTMDVNQQGQTAKIRLQIWDTAGGEQFRSLAPNYYKGAQAFCLVYDSTNASTFEALKYWTDQIRQMVATKHSIFIIAAKTDLSEKEAISIKEAGAFAKSNGATLHQTSAKEGTGVYELFQSIADKLYGDHLAGDFELPAVNSRSRQNGTQSFKIKAS